MKFSENGGCFNGIMQSFNQLPSMAVLVNFGYLWAAFDFKYLALIKLT